MAHSQEETLHAVRTFLTTDSPAQDTAAFRRAWQQLNIPKELARRILTVNGPGGTGKTYVVGMVLAELMKDPRNHGIRILITSVGKARIQAMRREFGRDPLYAPLGARINAVYEDGYADDPNLGHLNGNEQEGLNVDVMTLHKIGERCGIVGALWRPIHRDSDGNLVRNISIVGDINAIMREINKLHERNLKYAKSKPKDKHTEDILNGEVKLVSLETHLERSKLAGANIKRIVHNIEKTKSLIWRAKIAVEYCENMYRKDWNVGFLRNTLEVIHVLESIMAGSKPILNNEETNLIWRLFSGTGIYESEAKMHFVWSTVRELGDTRNRYTPGQCAIGYNIVRARYLNLIPKHHWMEGSNDLGRKSFLGASYDVHDFTSMLYMPLTAANHGHIDIPKYDIIYTDEAQDLTFAAWAMNIGVAHEKTRMVLSGDMFQTMMGFAAGKPEVYEAMQDLTAAIERQYYLDEVYRFHPRLGEQIEYITVSKRGEYYRRRTAKIKPALSVDWEKKVPRKIRRGVLRFPGYYKLVSANGWQRAILHIFKYRLNKQTLVLVRDYNCGLLVCLGMVMINPKVVIHANFNITIGGASERTKFGARSLFEDGVIDHLREMAQEEREDKSAKTIVRWDVEKAQFVLLDESEAGMTEPDIEVSTGHRARGRQARICCNFVGDFADLEVKAGEEYKELGGWEDFKPRYRDAQGIVNVCNTRGQMVVLYTAEITRMVNETLYMQTTQGVTLKKAEKEARWEDYCAGALEQLDAKAGGCLGTHLMKDLMTVFQKTPDSFYHHNMERRLRKLGYTYQSVGNYEELIDGLYTPQMRDSWSGKKINQFNCVIDHKLPIEFQGKYSIRLHNKNNLQLLSPQSNVEKGASAWVSARARDACITMEAPEPIGRYEMGRNGRILPMTSMRNLEMIPDEQIREQCIDFYKRTNMEAVKLGRPEIKNHFDHYFRNGRWVKRG